MTPLRCPRCGEAVAPDPPPASLRCSAEVVSVLGGGLGRRRHERFYVVALDARNRVIRRHMVAVGALTSCIVHPREVFALLIRDRAAAAILLHNHPSGVIPSPAPRTRR